MGIISISGKIGSGKSTIANIVQYLTSDLYRIDKFTFQEFVNYGKENKSTTWQNKMFADKIKDIVCILLGCTRLELEDREFKEKELGEEWWYYKPSDTLYPYLEFKEFENENCGIAIFKEDLIKLTPRLLMQLIGTECGRNIIHPNIWVLSLFNGYIGEKSWLNTKLTEHPEVIYPNWVISDLRFPNELKAVKDRKGITIRVNRDINEIKDIVFTLKDGSTESVKIIEHESEIALDNAEFDYLINNNGTIEDLIEVVKQILIKEHII